MSTENEVKSKASWIMGPRDFVYKYLNYVPWVAASLLVFLVLAYLKVRWSTPIFQVQSSMLIKNDRYSASSPQDLPFSEMFGQDMSNLSNEIEILKSRLVAERVAKDLGLQLIFYNRGKVRSSLLYPDRPFEVQFLRIADSSASLTFTLTLLDNGQFLLNENKTPMEFGKTIQIGGNLVIFQRNPSVDTRLFGSKEYSVTWVPLVNAAKNITSGLKVLQANEQSTILNLSFETENTHLGVDVLNAMMAVYDTLIVEDKNRIAFNTLRFINDRLADLNDTLRGVQGGLQNFMVDQQVYDIEGQSKNYLENYGESTKLADEQSVRIKIVNWLMDYIGNQKNSFELVPSNLGIEDASLIPLIAEYNRLQLEREANLKTTTRLNPLIVGLENSLDKVRRQIFEALSNVKQAYLIANANIERHSKDLQNKIESLPKKSISLLNIQRRQKILEDLYSLLLQKKIEVSISSASTISNSRVIEPALAGGNAVSPDRKKTYSFYALLGLVIPIGFIALKEILQDKVLGRIDVEKYTQAPILGEIGHAESEETLVVTKNSRRFISEQFRIIRSNLQYINGTKNKPVMMITSSQSGEGKSFISTNIGAVMALAGKKTVIMEFDIRKPKIVSGLELKRNMGITNYIIGKASFDDLLVKVSGVENLYVIPCGPIPPNPSELLLDSRLEELMKEVIEKFEVVIMDTAPIGLVSDAINLGRFATCTLYIVRYRHTFKKQLGLIQDLYANKKLPALAILLNDVKAEGAYYGGYYGGYGYYGRYYGHGGDGGYFDKEKKKRGGLFSGWGTRKGKQQPHGK